MKRAIILLVSFFVLVTCKDNPFSGGDFFFLVNKGAEMPVVVRGNLQSKVFIIFIHGGPGGSALQKVGLPVFNTLQQSYGMVYWDQRASGSSQGTSPDDLLTLDQFVEDLDQLIALINYRYAAPSIFLFGHSWGGCLGTAYLVDPHHQNKIKGWIEVDGAHDNPKGDSLSLQFVTSFAQSQIALNQDVKFWNYALDWYAKNPNFTSNQLEHYAFLEKAHGYIHDPSVKRSPKTFPEYSADYLFDSPADVTQELLNYEHVIKNFIISDIDLTSPNQKVQGTQYLPTPMKKITIPSLILWGQFDGVIPFPMAQQAYDALGTDPSKKSIVMIPNAAHFSFYEDPTLTAISVITFIEKYK